MKLTDFAKSAGCAGKLGPRDLNLALKTVPRQNIPQVLVGYENSDDAGVYQLTPSITIVQTVDFFPPIVDDPYTYGQIAAVNALSDVYAMGGEPRTALSIVGFPARNVENSLLADIMRGGLNKLEEAGVALLGGHSLRDDEIKFGYAVTGIVEVKNIKENRGAQIGDRVILTKPLGTGLITTAMKRGKASSGAVQAAIASMLQLNRTASAVALKFRVDTMTDVTGFGLAGHATEVARASRVSIHFDHRAIPALPEALEYSHAGFCAGGLDNNRDFFQDMIDVSESVAPDIRNLVFDPQTSGGLLIFVRAEDASAMLADLHCAEVPAVEIGFVTERSEHLLTLK